MTRVCISLAVIAAFAACGDASKSAGVDAPTVTVARGDLVFASSFYGEIEARESHPVLVPDFRKAWQVTIESVLADGSKVKKGDTVLTFSPGSFEEDLRDAEADLLVAQAELKKTTEANEDESITRTLAVQRAALQVELAKLSVVEGVNLISKLDLEKAKVDLQNADLAKETAEKELATFQKKAQAALDVQSVQVKNAQQKVDQLKGQLDQLAVKAPADGILYAPYTRLNWMMTKAAPGKVARPGDKILEIPELTSFNAAVYVRQRDATLVGVGDEANVVVTLAPDQPLKAKVVSKDDFAATRNERMGTSTPAGSLKEVKVVLAIEDTDLPLRPGGTVRADITTVLAKDVVLVPLAALDESEGVFHATKKDGSVVEVKVGKTSATHAEVLAGLAGGDAVRLGS
jgi:multidrug resistance efflux pump